MQKLGPNSNKTRIWTLREQIRPVGLFWGFTVFKVLDKVKNIAIACTKGKGTAPGGFTP